MASPIGPISSPEVDAALDSLLNSATFSKAFVLRQLLKYLWDHRHESLDEYTIAIHALGRKPDFDPKSDSAVRVTMARLRAKLKEFYESEGKNCRLSVWIPKNGYDLEYRLLENTSPEAPAAQPPPRPTREYLWLGIALALAAALVWAVLFRTPNTTTQQNSSAPPLPAFWAGIFAGEPRVTLVLPDTTFLTWKNRTHAVGDVTVDAFSSWNESSLLKAIVSEFGKPDGAGSYLPVEDALANLQLSQYLARFGNPVRVVSTRGLSVDSFLGTNVILMGLPETSYQLKSKIRPLDFQIDTGGASIRNLTPKPGEPSTFPNDTPTPNRLRSHAIFAVIPGRTPNTRTVVLAAANPLSFLPLLNSTLPLIDIERNWKSNGSPTYFQSVVESITEGESVLRIRFIAFRPFQPNN
jgi:hypothetical protein